MPPASSAISRIATTVVAILGLGLSLFHLYTAAFGSYGALLQRSVHLALTVGLGFLGYCAVGRRRKGEDVPGWADSALAVLPLLVFGAIAVRYKEIEVRQALVDPLSAWDMAVGVLGIVLVLEPTRRVAGVVLTVIGALFLAYALAGPYAPGPLAHRGFSLVDVVDYQVFGLNGIFGIPLGVSATYVVLHHPGHRHGGVGDRRGSHGHRPPRGGSETLCPGPRSDLFQQSRRRPPVRPAARRGQG